MIFDNKKWRKGIFMVVYRKCRVQGAGYREKDEICKIEFLIQKRKLHWKGFEFPKGGIEKGETRKESLRREIYEETGLPIIKIKNHHKRGRYLYNKELTDRPGIFGQTWSLYSVKVGNGKVRLDKKEHYSSEWLEYKDARKKLTWDNQKKCLDVVFDWLKNSK